MSACGVSLMFQHSRYALFAMLSVLCAVGVWSARSVAAPPAAAPQAAAPHGGVKLPVRALTIGNCNTPTTPFCDAEMAPIAGWTGHVFHLSQNYPSAAPQDVQPWLKLDPTTQSNDYLKAVLAYFYEGNIQSDVESSFDPASNHVRGWYHAPWQDTGTNGREFVHGLTRERVSQASPPELDPHQKHAWNNYAVGFYNAPGGVAIGRVWANHGAPNAAAATMPEGTVAAKLLFTTATTSEVPFLQGAPQWNAYIYSNVNSTSPGSSPRAVIPVRLLQIDVAVKDSRVASTTGWVFGTFVYGGGPGGAPGTGWTNVAPVGTMWGNDPGFVPGSGSLKETNINQAVHMLHLGYQGRLNGPVDNKASSCLSCHSTAGVPGSAMLPPTGSDPAHWFRNVPSGQPFDPGSVSTDYSLQLAVGIRNFGTQRALLRASPQQRAAMLKKIRLTDQRPPRDGGPLH